MTSNPSASSPATEPQRVAKHGDRIYFSCTHCGKNLSAPIDTQGKTGRCPRCQQLSQIPKAEPTIEATKFPPPYPDEYDDIPPIRWLKRVFGGTPPAYRGVQRRAAERLATLNRVYGGLNRAANDTPREVEQQVQLLRERACQARLEAMGVERLQGVGPARARILQQYGYGSIGQLRNVSPQRLQSLPNIGPATAVQIARAVAATVAEESRRPLRLPLPDEVRPEHHPLLRAAFKLVSLSRHLPAETLAQLEQECYDLEELLASARKSSSLLVRMWYSPNRRQWELEAHQDLAKWLSTSSDLALSAGAAALEAIEPPLDPVSLVDDYRSQFARYASVLERYFAPPAKTAVIPAELATAAPHRGIFGALPASIASAVEKTTLSLRTVKMHLRGYQEFGAKYIIAQRRTVLGDEMGLGKTIQAMAALTHLFETQQSIRGLVVSPAGIVGNWVRELEDKTVLPMRLLHGPDRERENRLWTLQGGVGVTSYETLANITGLEQPLDMLIVDEAHYVKNPDAKRSKRVDAVAQKARHVVLMTGTPLENRPTEFLNLIRMCDKSLMGGLERQGSLVSPVAFETQIAPVYLRRNQDDVLHELPECILTDEWVSLSPADEAAYRQAVQGGDLMTMRRKAVGSAPGSGKLQRLQELLETYREMKAKVVVFSFFLEVLDRVGELVGPHWRMDGRVPRDQRMNLIDDFTREPGFAVMACQITSGGVGINLQCASVVVLMEPQLKPTTEWQAISRVHRMGQTRRVVAHRLLARDTVEERLIEMLGQKSATFDKYARESAVKRASPAAVDTSEAALVQAEKTRLNVA